MSTSINPSHASAGTASAEVRSMEALKELFSDFWLDDVWESPGIVQSAPVDFDGVDALFDDVSSEWDVPRDVPRDVPWGEPGDSPTDARADAGAVVAADVTDVAADGSAAEPVDPVEVIRAGVAVGESHASWLGSIPSGELAELVAAADRAVAVWETVRARAVLEAEERGVIAESGCSTPVWITRHAVSLRQGGAYALARLVKITRQANSSRLAGSDPVAGLDPESALGIVWEHLSESALSVTSALGVLSEAQALAPRLVPEAVPTVTRGLCVLAGAQGLREMKRLRPALLARHGAPGEVDDLQEKLAACAVLSSPGVCSTGLTEYALRLTPAQAAVLEAAIGPLAAPRPNPVTGEADLRSAGQRRAEALAEVLARGAALHAVNGQPRDTNPGSGSGTSSSGSPSTSGPSAGGQVRPVGRDDTGGVGTGSADSPEVARRHGGPGRLDSLGDAGSGSDAGDASSSGDVEDAGSTDDAGAHGGGVVGATQTSPDGEVEGEVGLVAASRVMATALPSSTALYVTIGLQSLLAGIGAGEVIGSRAAGTFLSPAQVRRLACDAEIIPTVLGSQSQILDQGRATRLFDPAQRRALWHRDRGCTYPGCSAPPTWTRAHHIRHWLDHGPSDLSNATLLCQRHHTLVHQRRLAATVSPVADEHGRYVHWDLTPGSYAYDR